MEALRLLGSELPDDWPACPRKSRQALLRRLICDKKKSAKARIAALRELLCVGNEPQATATPEVRSEGVHMPEPGTCQMPSEDSQAMLRSLGKNHLREITAEEFERYCVGISYAKQLEVGCQWREWVVTGDDDLLEMIGLSKLKLWQDIRDQAQTVDVRENAEREIKQLEGGDGH
jgi:hypothetical protein